MISHIKLNNWQTWQKLDLPLGQVTTIVGESDVGKSAILRAMRWIFFNVPRGSNYVHWDEHLCWAKIYLGEGTIKRRRCLSGSSKGNEYIVTQKGKKSVYKAVSTGVPEPVQEMLQVCQYNYQSQHDSVFWFSATSSQVAEQLNAIVDMSEIDQVLARSKKELSARASTLRVRKADMEQAEEDAKELTWVPAMLEKYERIETVRAALGNAEADILRIEKNLEWLQELTDNAESVQEANALIDAVETTAKRLQDVTDETDRILALLTEHRSAKESLAELKESIPKLETELHNLNQGKCPLCQQPMT